MWICNYFALDVNEDADLGIDIDTGVDVPFLAPCLLPIPLVPLPLPPAGPPRSLDEGCNALGFRYTAISLSVVGSFVSFSSSLPLPS